MATSRNKLTAPQTDRCFSGRRLWPTNSTFPADYSPYWNWCVLQVQRQLKLMEFSPTPQEPNVFQVVWSSFHVGWPVDTQSRARNFNICQNCQPQFFLCCYNFYSTKLSISLYFFFNISSKPKLLWQHNYRARNKKFVWVSWKHTRSSSSLYLKVITAERCWDWLQPMSWEMNAAGWGAALPLSCMVWVWCLGEAPEAGLGAVVTQHLPWLAWDKNQATATQTASLIRYQPRAAVCRENKQALSIPRTLVWLACLPPAPVPGSLLWAALSRAPAPRGSRYRNAAALRLLVPERWSSAAFQEQELVVRLLKAKFFGFFFCVWNQWRVSSIVSLFSGINIAPALHLRTWWVNIKAWTKLLPKPSHYGNCSFQAIACSETTSARAPGHRYDRHVMVFQKPRTPLTASLTEQRASTRL